MKLITQGTAANFNVGTAANNVVQLDGSAKLPAVDGSQLTNLSSALSSKVLTATRDVSLASGTQDITGCGFNPTAAVVMGAIDNRGGWGYADSTAGNAGMYSSSSSVPYYVDAGARVLTFRQNGTGDIYDGAVSFITDGIRITWTKTGVPTGTANIYILALK